MKKITYLLFVLGLVILTFILGFLIIHKTTEEISIKTIKKVYSLADEDNNLINIPIFFSKEDLSVTYVKNVTASIGNSDGSLSVSVEAKEIEKLGSEKYEDGKYISYRYSFQIPKMGNDFVIEQAFLTLTSAKEEYQIEIGSLEIYKLNNTASNLIYDDLYGIFNDIGGFKSLSGIVISLKNQGSNSLFINDIFLSSLVNINIDKLKIISKENYTNETDILESNSIFQITLSNAKFEIKPQEEVDILIPLEYYKMILIDNAFLDISLTDGTNMIISNFPYSITSYDLNSYKSIVSSCNG